MGTDPSDCAITRDTHFSLVLFAIFVNFFLIGAFTINVQVPPYCATPDLDYLAPHGQAARHQSARRPRYHARPRSRGNQTLARVPSTPHTPHAAPLTPSQDTERTLPAKDAGRWLVPHGQEPCTLQPASTAGN
jgi:hypothetical protein